ncbi:MAG: SecY family transport protein [Cyanobium sp. MAG06]|nr:SecY family transport protein [Cyanobium sp. MAG06]
MNEKGIGNGVSLIILGGIVAGLPSKIQSILQTGSISTQLSIYIALAIMFIIVLFGIVAITEAERPLAVTYAKQSRGYAGGQLSSSYIPIRLTTAGVIPIIFAVSLLSIPSILQGLVGTGESSNGLLLIIISSIAKVFNNPTLYAIIYFSLVFIFTFFYTFVMFDPVRTSDQIQKGGAFIPGVRPGENTVDHISGILIKVTLIGALFLGTVAVLPIVISDLTGISAITVGGTSLLITVSVIMDLIKKIDAQMTMSEYSN